SLSRGSGRCRRGSLKGDEERRQGGTDRRWNRNGTPAPAINPDVNEAAGRGRLVVALQEQPDLVCDRGIAQLRYAHAGVDDVGKRQRLVKPARCLDDQPDLRPGTNVEPTRTDQMLVHRGIEVRVKAHVVDVAVR